MDAACAQVDDPKAKSEEEEEEETDEEWEEERRQLLAKQEKEKGKWFVHSRFKTHNDRCSNMYLKYNFPNSAFVFGIKI